MRHEPRPETHATLTIDGSVNHQTCEAGAAAVLKFFDGSHQSSTEAFHSRKSSEAELRALEIGLRLARQHEDDITHLIVYGDSESVTDAINGDGRFPKHYRHLNKVLTQFQDVHAIHLPRSENREADLLARIARPKASDGRRKRVRRDPSTYRSSQFYRNKRKRRMDPQKRFA